MIDPAPLPPASPATAGSAFPDPPASTLPPQSVAQPSIDSILAQSLISADPAAATPKHTSVISVPNKEMLPPRSSAEAAPMVELNESEPMPPEVEGWLQKLDTAGDIKLPEPVTHDGNVLLANSEAQIVKEKIVLPLSQTGVQQGLTAKVTDSARWLAEWCIKLIKSMKNGVKYAPETTTVSPEKIPNT